jgi:hypothetical protein
VDDVRDRSGFDPVAGDDAVEVVCDPKVIAVGVSLRVTPAALVRSECANASPAMAAAMMPQRFGPARPPVAGPAEWSHSVRPVKTSSLPVVQPGASPTLR